MPADVNEIARWHLNVLLKDRSLLLQLSHGVLFICIPRSDRKLALTGGALGPWAFRNPEGLLYSVVTLSGSDKRHVLREWHVLLSASEGPKLFSYN